MNRNMSNRRLVGGIALSLLALGLFSTQALAQVGGPITGSKHDLTALTGPVAGAYKFTSTVNTTEMCVFCHTPHGAATNDIPLWNRSYAGGVYQAYSALNSVTTQSAFLAVGSSSLACLSCHDGGQAMNVMINTPGSGTAGTYAGTWTTGPVTGQQIGASLAFIGLDLRNDHPISIQYGGGPLLATSIPTTDGTSYTAFEDPEFKSVSSSGTGTAQRWWVNTPIWNATGGTAARERTDMQLYGRTGAYISGASTVLASINQPYVECGTCHDPHNSRANPGNFLRTGNGGSAICLACHDK